MNEKNRSNIFGGGVTGLALLFMGIGAARGELLVVWMKAINVCLECIGIG